MLDHLPHSKVMQQILDSHFSLWETRHRVLHRETFEASYDENFSAEVKDGYPASLPLLTAVVALYQASHATLKEGGHSQTWCLVGATALDRCHLLREYGSIAPRKQRLKIEFVQMLVLLLLAEMTLFTPSEIVWQSVGAVIRIAQTMGLHLDVGDISTLTEPEKEARTELWATIMKLDQQLSKATGMSPLASSYQIPGHSSMQALPDRATSPWWTKQASAVVTRAVTLHSMAGHSDADKVAWHIWFSQRGWEVKQAIIGLSTTDHSAPLQLVFDALATTIHGMGSDLKELFLLIAATHGTDPDALEKALRRALSLSQASDIQNTEIQQQESASSTENTEIFSDLLDFEGLDFDTGWAAVPLQY